MTNDDQDENMTIPKPSPFRTFEPEVFARMEAQRAERARQQMEYRAALPIIRKVGEQALRRLLEIAQRDSGQCRRVAGFLLSLYNGFRFKFDLTDLRGLDLEIYLDCMAVLAMDYTPQQEVHRYFDKGGEIWETLAKAWNVPDREQLHYLISQASFRGLDAEKLQADARRYLDSGVI
jgi:hypothetical protein